MSTVQGMVLRNAAVAEQTTRLVGPERARAANAGEEAQAPAPGSMEGGGPAQDRLDEAYRRGYEQGVEEGKQRTIEAVLAAEMESARQEGLKQGCEAGLRAAQETASASVNEALATLERVLATIPQQLQARMAALEEDMVALSFEALVRVLGETAASPAGLRALLRQALSQFGPRHLLEVRVHPGDLQCLLKDDIAGTWLRQREGYGEHARFVADASIEFGGVVLRSPAGTLDARLDTQLEGLRRLLLDVRAQRLSAHSVSPSAQGEPAVRPSASPAQGGAA